MQPLRTAALLAALAVLVHALPADAQQTPRKRARTVQPGMTPAQVVARLGEPARVTAGPDGTTLFFPACAGCQQDYVVVRDCRVVDARLTGSRYYLGEDPVENQRLPSDEECIVEARGAATDTRAPRLAITPPERPRDADPGAIPADRPRLPVPTPPDPVPVPPTPARVVDPDTTLPCPPPARGADTIPDPGVMTAADVPPAEWRRRLDLDVPRQRLVALPAAAFFNPTAFGLDYGQAYVGVGYQARTRYTDLDDAAVVAGVGLGDRNRAVGVEITLSSYSTVRGGGPLETGGVGVKVHRTLDSRTGIAAGVENLINWGGSDAGRSGYAVLSRAFRRTAEPSTTLNALVASIGVGNGRFRFEDDVLDDKETINVFGSAGLQIIEPVALIGEWTGQDLGAAISVTPFRYRPLVISVGAVDLTRTAGDGPRLVVTAAYGFVVPLPFQ
jgi:hypothetical protein